MLRQLTLAAVIALPVAGSGFLVGCEEEIASEKTVDVKDDGTVITDETTVTKDGDGEVTKTEEKKVDAPE